MSNSIDWSFGGLWPYPPRWFITAEGHQMHYVDVGPSDAPVVVLIHGNPTWGFLYRNFIPPLVAAGYRVVVPDLIGFGRSDKPTDKSAYTIAAHMESFSELLSFLDLHDVTIVPQDWGGPIGMRWAASNSDRIAALFLLNTAAHVPVETWKVPLILRVFQTPGAGEVLVKGLKLFHRGFLFGQGIVNRDRMTREIRAAYLAPHQRWSDCTGVLEFPRAIPAAPTDEPWRSLGAPLERDMERHLRNKPVKIVWAMNDPGFRPDTIEKMWLRTFPHADVTYLDGVGHYLQEDAHEQIVPLLVQFLGELPERA